MRAPNLELVEAAYEVALVRFLRLWEATGRPPLKTPGDMRAALRDLSLAPADVREAGLELQRAVQAVSLAQPILRTAAFDANRRYRPARSVRG